MRTLIPTVVILSLIPFSLYASGQSNSGGLAKRVAELEAQVEVLAAALQETQEILQLVHVETELMEGLPGPHWIIEGVNVHVRSGLGQTQPRACPGGDPDCISSNHLGNLMVGYNEVRPHSSLGDMPPSAFGARIHRLQPDPRPDVGHFALIDRQTVEYDCENDECRMSGRVGRPSPAAAGTTRREGRYITPVRPW